MFTDSDNWENRSEGKRGVKARSFIHRVGRENVDDLLMVRLADRAGKYAGKRPEGWDAAAKAFEADVRAQMDAPLTLKELEIDGNDLLAIGYQGRAISLIQNELMDRIVAQPHLNTDERLQGWAEKLLPTFTSA